MFINNKGIDNTPGTKYSSNAFHDCVCNDCGKQFIEWSRWVNTGENRGKWLIGWSWCQHCGSDNFIVGERHAIRGIATREVRGKVHEDVKV